MDKSPSIKSRRTLRTYARREDAEQARAALADHNIEAVVEEHFFKAHGAKGGEARTSGGCSLMADADKAAEAARVLLKMPPSETAGRPKVEPVPGAASPLRRRSGPRMRQKSSAPMIVIAIFCSALGLYWVVRQAMRGAFVPVPETVLEEDPRNIFVEEDVNWDGGVDSIREYSPAGQILSTQEDRNFDGTMDLRWIWQRGQLIYRDRDIDGDGVMDERTTFDGYNEPFYVDLRNQGKGPVVLRRIFSEGKLWKILEDRDADTHFDWIREYGADGVLIRDEALEKGSPENGVPKPGGVRPPVKVEEPLPLQNSSNP